MKVVLDTNVLLQILGRFSPYHKIWESFLNEEIILCTSNEILLEYEEILKQKASSVIADLFLKTIEFSNNVIKKDPFYKLQLITNDSDDNKFVDCAFATQANFIVTNDAHFKELLNITFPKIPIISLDDFYKNFIT
jgi:putative PIN family toxin of toxin-antitoxin system